jgi:hypothetical protein
LASRGRIEYKLLVGVPGDGSWDGVAFQGENRVLWVQDPDRSGRVRLETEFGVRADRVSDP